MTALLQMTIVVLVWALALSACAGPANPASLWVSHGAREVDLLLIDHEPPPY